MTNPFVKGNQVQKLGHIFAAVIGVMKWKDPNNEVLEAKEKTKEGAKLLLQVAGKILCGESNNSGIMMIGITDSETGVQGVNL